MHFYKYGIAVKNWYRENSIEWRIALIDGSARESTYIDVRLESFDYQPSLGDSVKVKFDDRTENPISITKCNEWIRDVEVVDSRVVIFIILHLSASMRCRRLNSDRVDFIVESEDSDFQRISIPEDVIDELMENRSPLQKEEEPLAFRVGVCWSQISYGNGIRANWRYYEDFPIVPIFELFVREMTLPFISESLVYGVLDGIVIAENEEGVLFWSRQMGCSILSRVTRQSPTPPVGSVRNILVKRCLVDVSFGFPCHYELLPELRKSEWEGIRVIADKKYNCVYIEAYCEPVKMTEKSSIYFCMVVPNLGKVWKGVQQFWKTLEIGQKYYFRIEFRKEQEEEYAPVVVDLCLPDDEFVECRLLHICHESKTYFAILDPRGTNFDDFKQHIDFISIPFRVLFAAKGVHLKNEDLLKTCFRVRIRLPRDFHDVVEALHVTDVFNSEVDADFTVVENSVWIHTSAVVEKKRSDAIELLCPKSCLQIIDYRILPKTVSPRQQFLIHAQFVLSSGNVPAFHARRAEPISPNSMDTVNRRFDSFGESEDVDDDEEDIHTILDEQEYELRYGTSPLMKPLEEEDLVLTESVLLENCTLSEQDRTIYSEPGPSKIHVTENAQFNRPRSSPFAYRDNRKIDFPRPRGRSTKYGFREVAFGSHQHILHDAVYKFRDNRRMFVEHERDAITSWFRRPNSKVTASKKRVVLVFGVELVDYSNDYHDNYCEFEYLVRFTVLERDMDIGDTSVVVAFGGRRFPKLPKSFQLGERYFVTHFSFTPDRMCRFGGFAHSLSTVHFEEDQKNGNSRFRITNLETRENSRGQQFLRFRTNAIRPAEPEFRSDLFEFWIADDVPGYVIVEKTKKVMKFVEPLDPDIYVQDNYNIVVEPLAGGPINLFPLRVNSKFLHEPYVLWRMVIEFSESVPPPRLIERKKKKFEVIRVLPPNRDYQPREDGYWKTIEINSELAQQRLDRMRAAGDDRVKLLDGPDLTPEIELRKVDVDLSRKRMFEAMEAILRNWETLYKMGIGRKISEKEFTNQMENLKEMTDNYHKHQFRKRKNSLDVGMNSICNMIVEDKKYKLLNENCEKTENLIKFIADAIDLNMTYVKRTEDVRKMILYFRKNKLLPYT